jgi:tRNA pseudouridine55 synthase
MEGLLNIDKPLEMTSHDVVAQVRRLAQMRRVGHGGTLDPLASGVLVLALGRATRLLEYVMGQKKAYRARVRLGQVTNTYDAEGEIVQERAVDVTRAEVEQALDGFRGEIEQVPPMYSAIKRKGKPLYELARRGVEVEREARQVTIYELRLEAWEPLLLTLYVECSTGTYIRSLAHDLGQALGCGAYLAALRRLSVGSFTLENAVPLEELTPENVESHIQPPQGAVAHLPRLELREEEAQRLAQGQRVAWRMGQPDAELVRAFDGSGQFVGVVAEAGGEWQPRKIFYEV